MSHGLADGTQKTAVTPQTASVNPEINGAWGANREDVTSTNASHQAARTGPPARLGGCGRPDGKLMFAYMTGWRIGSILALRREDVDLDNRTAHSRAADNKGKRDQRIVLHSFVRGHLTRLPSFSPLFFSWNHNRRQLFVEFDAIQHKAGVKPEWGKKRYGSHDLRRAFATMNAALRSLDVLQALMQHRACTTTQCYIKIARQLGSAAHNLFVPDANPISQAH